MGVTPRRRENACTCYHNEILMSTFNPGDLPLFAGLSRKELDRVVSFGTNVDVAAGQILTEQGTLGQQCFVVCTGSVAIVRDGETIAEAGPGDIIGEIALLDENHVRTATARAVTDSEIVVFSSPEFAGLVDDMPIVGNRVRQTAVHRLVEALTHSAPTSR